MAEMKKHCNCGVKLISKYLDVGKCAGCQGKHSTYEYYKERMKFYDEKHGITKEERAKINRERVNKSRHSKKILI